MKSYFSTLAAIIFFIPFFIQAQITFPRIEPPFWWTGMADSTLQLMVYGQGIAGAEVITDSPGIRVGQTRRGGNPNYLFVDLVIGRDARPGGHRLIFEYQREVLLSYDYELKERKPGSRERVGFGKDDVIYLIMPDRFSDGDTSNNNLEAMLERTDRTNPDGRHGGDLRGIRERLDYLSRLGITAIWLNPVLENNMPAYSYHGYAITDFYRVDPRFGGDEEYLAFVDDCHSRGIKVIMDMVFNHCGDRHWWMQDMPMDDWIHQFPEYTRSNFRAETVMDPYASDFDRTRMQTGWFDRHMPDLNQQNEILAQYLIQNSIWWIEYAGLDGIRMDTYPYSYKEFMAKWMERIRLEYPSFSVVGETWLQKEAHTAFWQDRSPVSGNYASKLDFVTDFPLYYALKDAFTQEEGWTTGLARIYYVLSQDLAYHDPFSNVIFSDNHDLTRFYTSIGEDINKYRMAMAILLTTRGIPMIYYGTELQMTGEEHKGHGFIREDFPLGLWQSAVSSQQSAVIDREKVVGGAKEMEFKALAERTTYLMKLLNWRNGSEVIHSGKLKQFVPQDGIYVYFRYNDDDAVMVAVNKNKEAKSLSLQRFEEVLKDHRTGRDVISEESFLMDKILQIPAGTALVLELE